MLIGRRILTAALVFSFDSACPLTPVENGLRLGLRALTVPAPAMKRPREVLIAKVRPVDHHDVISESKPRMLSSGAAAP